MQNYSESQSEQSFTGPSERRTRNGAYRLGCYVRHNWASILMFALVLMLIVSLYGALVDCEVHNASVGTVIQHYGCKGKGGCAHNCPYVDPNDPRYAIAKHLKVVKNISAELNKAYGQTHEYVADMLSKLDEATTTRLTNVVAGPSQTMYDCVNNVFPILTKLEDMSVKYASQSSPTPELYDVQNRAAALEAAAIINLRVASMSSMKIGVTFKEYRLSKLSDYEKSKIHNFEDEYTKAVVAKTAVDAAYQSSVIYISNAADMPNNYGNSTRAIMTNETQYEQVISTMARLINISQDASTLEHSTRAQYNIIDDVHDRAVELFEGFNNSLPGTVTSEEMSSLIVGGDYNTALIKTALEPEIVTNHQKFANERMAFDSGGGVPSVRDDDNDVNPWVGLFGRPTYKKTNGTSADISSEPLRSIPSTDPNSLMRASTPRLTF